MSLVAKVTDYKENAFFLEQGLLEYQNETLFVSWIFANVIR